MKKLIFIFVITPFWAKAQNDEKSFERYFLGNYQTARSLGLGKSFAAMDDDIGSLLYNPAGTARLKSANFNLSSSYPDPSLTPLQSMFGTISYRFREKLLLGLSYRSMKKPDDANIRFYDVLTDPHYSTVSLNVSSALNKKYTVGMNANLVQYNSLTDDMAFYLDLGAIRKFISKSGRQELNTGLSLSNVNATRISTDDEKNVKIPVLGRVSISYRYKGTKLSKRDSLQVFKLWLNGELQPRYYYDQGMRFSLSSELSFFEIISLRIGYFSEQRIYHDLMLPGPEMGKEERRISYGFSLELPAQKLFAWPFVLSLDFAETAPETLFKFSGNRRMNSSASALRLNYIL